MARLCKHCGMESDTDRVCSWCGKPLGEAKGPPSAGGSARPAAGGEPRTAGAGRRGRHAGAAEALLAADRARREIVVWPYYLIGAGVLLVLIFGGFGVAYALATRAPAAPSKWTSRESQTKLISLQAPENWHFSTSGATASYERVRVESGLYRVLIVGNPVLGTLGDISAAAARVSAPEEGGEQPLEKRAEGRLHMTLAEKEAKVDPAFKEGSEMQATRFAGLPAAYSYYTTKRRVGLFTVPMRGLRMTVPSVGDLALDIRALAPAKHWDHFEPIAKQVLESAQRGAVQS